MRGHWLLGSSWNAQACTFKAALESIFANNKVLHVPFLLPFADSYAICTQFSTGSDTQQNMQVHMCKQCNQAYSPRLSPFSIKDIKNTSTSFASLTGRSLQILLLLLLFLLLLIHLLSLSWHAPGVRVGPQPTSIQCFQKGLYQVTSILLFVRLNTIAILCSWRCVCASWRTRPQTH